MMHSQFSRRAFLGAMATEFVGCTRVVPRAPEPTPALVDIERRIGGRLGVYAIATDSGSVLAYRQDERFALCSTFKWVLAAAVLCKIDEGALTLTEEVAFGAKDLLEYAPVCRRNVGRASMTIRELAQAAVSVSDNTAANLLLERVGGPGGLTHFLRAHGDAITRLDRNEPTLNTNSPGDLRDTTTPQAMAQTLRSLLLTAVLSLASRELLLGWMRASTTGTQRIRAGLPATWQVGDKTGSGARGAVNDVAIAWPPHRAPLLMAVYMSDSESPLAELSAAHAQIGRIIVAQLVGDPTSMG